MISVRHGLPMADSSLSGVNLVTEEGSICAFARRERAELSYLIFANDGPVGGVNTKALDWSPNGKFLPLPSDLP